MAAYPATHRRMTPEEYFAWSEEQEVRYEYFDGEVFAMAGGTRDHALITSNLIRLLGNALSGSGCRVFTADLRVQIAESTRYTYPDLTVVCGEERFLGDSRVTLLNPTLLVEVLSDSTADYDRGSKFEGYRRIWSLREVVFVAQDRPAVEVFRRGGDGRWTLFEPEGGAVTLASVGATVPVEEVYEGVDFSARPPGGRPGAARAASASSG